MSEIKVGEYVRTNEGIIDKVINNNYYMPAYVELKKGIILRENIKNHKEKLIKLLEEGDYVNGYELSEFDDEEGNLYLGIPIYDDALMNSFTEIRPLNTIEIKSIVTKEQFEKVMYKVGE